MKRVSDNLLKSRHFFSAKWTDLCPLCPPALSSRCPPAVQPENKYSIYFSGVKNTVFIFGLENTPIKNTGINFAVGKIPELFLLWEKYRN